jgi:hypothetical protein
MEEVEIIRLNVERYRRLLQTNLDEQTRRATQAMLAEFASPGRHRSESSSNPGQRRRQRAALRSLVLSRKTSRPNRRETLPTEFPKQSRRRS